MLALFGAGALLLWILLIAAGVPGLIRMTRLHAGSPAEEPKGGWPTVSIVLAARNEADSIEAGVRSLLELSYPALELVLVDDRSDDRTGAIMEAMAAGDRRVKTVAVRSLPEGWVGKNYALLAGAEQAGGDWLLFTDADVHLHPDALKVAAAHAAHARLDHLTLAPAVLSRRFLLGGVVAMFVHSLMLFRMPQYAKRRGPFYMGIGAFNLVRRDVYQAIGTHAALRNRPDDDLQLGRLVKRAGFAQDFATGFNLVEVEWYTSLAALLRGIEKNCLTTFEYSFGLFAAGVLFIAAFDLLPLAGLLFGPLWLQVASAVVWGIACLHFTFVSRGTLRSLGYFVLWPFFVVLFIVTLLRANFMAHLRGGLVWRDTIYPFSVLRERVRAPGSMERVPRGA